MRLKLLILVFCFSYSNGIHLSERFENVGTPSHLANSLKGRLKASNTEISPDCLKKVLYYAENLRNKNALWALNMFDATSKVPSGLLVGNSAELGSFDQCLKIHEPKTAVGTIGGKYCLAAAILDLTNTKTNTSRSETNNIISIRWSTCLPDTCSAADIQEIYKSLGLNFLKFSDDLCQTESSQPELDGGDIAMISFLSFILCLVISSSAYDVFVDYKRKNSLSYFLASFSLFTNGKKLAEPSNDKQISCLHGIRAISMLWVMLGHRYSTISYLPLRNALDIKNWLENKVHMVMLSATLACDTFFVITGALIVYGFMVAQAKGVRFNILKYYAHRIIRLTPLLAVIIAFHLTLLKHFGSGPMWPSYMETHFIKGCQKYWWTSLLYVQNYVDQDAICVTQSWYLAIDMQLFLLSPLVLLPLKKYPRFTLACVGLLIFCSVLTGFLVAWFYKINALLINNISLEDIKNFMQLYYVPTHTRAGPWLIGILLGYFIYTSRYEKKISLNRILTGALWPVSISILLACVFAGENFILSEYDRLGNSFHVALVRPAWAIGLCWVIFGCVNGYGGPINAILSLDAFQLLSKLSYSIFLVHYTVMAVVSANTKAPLTFGDIEATYMLSGDVPTSVIVSVILTLAFEYPVVNIENVIFRTKNT